MKKFVGVLMVTFALLTAVGGFTNVSEMAIDAWPTAPKIDAWP